MEKMKVLIVGGGKVGYYLSKTLLEHGHEPIIIENNKAACMKLANDLDIPVICGDGTSIDVLESAGAARMDALISVTGKDEDNLISCQLAKKMFVVPKTVARVNNPKNAAVMRQLGIDIAVSGTDSMARMLEHEVDTSAIKQLITLNQGESTISEILIPHDYKYSGYTLSQLKIPEDAIIISINRKNKIIIPRGNAQVLSDDRLLIMAKTTMYHELKHILKLGQ